MADVPSDFTISDEQALKAFSDYESRAKRAGSSGQQPVIGEQHVVDVAYLNEAVVQLSIIFTPPLVVAQKRGYRFGSVRGRTAADRQAMINQMNARVERGRREVAFETVLIVPAAVEDDENASLPSISFALLDKDGKRLRPRRTPDLRLRAMPTGSADPPSVAFPLYSGETLNLTKEMDKVTLVVVFDGDEESEETLEFRLNK